ncbi:MAG: hypothetical protein LBE59_04160 [Nevskiaceae bacterium]|jgi:hypothetical protein|nr:hypothetical protein [Nevskiaceae bacterium]
MRSLIGFALALAATTATAADDLWPKLSFDTVLAVDYANMESDTGPDRGPGFVLWGDSTLTLEVSDALSFTGLVQFKPRASLPEDNPNNELFINRGLNRQEGGKFKELYLRYGDWRVGKFVQNFGRAYGMLGGPWASDLTEEPEAYEPSEMLGVERVYVFDDESSGWRQLTLSAFIVDRTFLHRSYPYDEGMIRYKDGGVGNTRLPENVLLTYDVINKPLGDWSHLSYQAGVIRWGKTYGSEASEWWTTLGSNLVIPLRWGVADTLRGRYSQLQLYAEAVRRDNFEGVDGRTRTFLTGSAEYTTGRWVLELATTQRWTTERAQPRQRDKIYSASIGYNLPSQTTIALSAAREQIGSQSGLYAGIRVTQTLTACSKCMLRGRAY